MMKLTIRDLVKDFGFNPAELIGKEVKILNRGEGNGTSIIKSMDHNNVNVGGRWHDMRDVALTKYTKSDLAKITKYLKKYYKNYMTMLNYCKERNINEYDVFEVALDRVIESIKVKDRAGIKKELRLLYMQ